jgi:hypothetical protein
MNPILAWICVAVFAALYLGFVFFCFRFAHDSNRPWQARGVGVFAIWLPLFAIYNDRDGPIRIALIVLFLVSIVMIFIGFAQD